MNKEQIDEILRVHKLWLENRVDDGERADLSGADLRGADLRGCDLRFTDLRGADLSYVDLRVANLSFANLSYANLSYANLRHAGLAFADLSGADLSFADLISAELSRATLVDADLSDCDLSHAGLAFADLSGAILVDADLSGAKLTNCRLPAIAPTVDNLDGKILQILTSGDGDLDMTEYHTCETTHCVAGWAIHLAGDEGRELEKKVGPSAAGAMIYHRSCGVVPDFHCDDEDAVQAMKERVRSQD